MSSWKLFYIFKDPMGAVECKIGISKCPKVRLGTYQISYSRNSHVACFDRGYLGPPRAIDLLERAVKQQFDWNIERDGRGVSEWINLDHAVVEQEIDRLICGYGFQIKKIPKQFLPLTVDNFDQCLTILDESVILDPTSTDQR